MKLESENFEIKRDLLGQMQVHEIFAKLGYGQIPHKLFIASEQELSELKNLITDYLQELDMCCKQGCGNCGNWEL